MASNIKRHVTHIKSKDLINGKAKLPKPSDILEGEIAINYHVDHEAIAILNSSGNIATFSSDNVLAGLIQVQHRLMKP